MSDPHKVINIRRQIFFFNFDPWMSVMTTPLKFFIKTANFYSATGGQCASNSKHSDPSKRLPLWLPF